MDGIQELLNRVREEGFARIIPSIDIDSLLASGILAKYAMENGLKTTISLDLKSIIDEKDTLHILIGFPEGFSTFKNTHEIVFDGETSISAKILKYTGNLRDQLYLNKLAILGGHYRLLDLGAEGFKGYEREILSKTPSEEIESILGFRLWGFQRKTMKNTLYRTLYPFLPGITGELEVAERIAREVPGILDGESAKRLANLLLSNMRIDGDIKEKLLIKIVGHIYMIKIMDKRIDSGELLGSLMVYAYTGLEKPYDVAATPLINNLFRHFNVYYEEYIDIVASEASMIINQLLSTSNNVVETDYIVRPELLVDILDVIEKINVFNKPLTIISDSGKYTCVRELIRLGHGFDEVINRCNEEQLCMVEE